MTRSAAATPRTPDAGDPAPDFDLAASDAAENGRVALRDLRGGWVVLYFYPADFTPGCTREACDFRDLLASERMNATVLGVSPDPVASHRRFRAEHRLGFPLLADEDHAVSRAYGAYGPRGESGDGVKRATFLIDPDGVIARAYRNVKADGHAARVAEDLARLQN